MTSDTKGRLRRSRRRQCEGLSISAIIAVLVSTLGLSGQTPPAAPSGISDNLAQGRAVFAARCAGCHGADALGTDRAPKLVGSRSVSQRSTFRLRELIQTGIQGTGMPAFDLPPNELDAIVALVHSFSWQAADSNVPGDSVAGERFFFGQGQCASCHMIAGKGKPIGPDLSNIGSEKTVDELKNSMLHPRPRAKAGYDLVTVKLRSGRTIRGFARGRSNFDIRLEDLDGNFQVFQQAEIASIEDEPQSWMPPLPADSPELQNLMAYLSRQTGVKTEPIVSTGEHAGIEFSDILHPKPGEWPSYNGKLSGNRYSELNQINATNVNRLVVKWIFTVPLWKQLVPDTPYFVENMKYFGLETTPIVADGTMYIRFGSIPVCGPRA
jgi:putative heme-binding domain-containing protein